MLTLLIQFIVNGVAAGSVLALNSMGFSLIYGTCRQFHIAQAGIFVCAGYATYAAMAYLHLPLLGALLVAIIVAAALGLGVSVLIYEPVLRLGARQLIVFICSLGTLAVIENILRIVFGNDPLFVTLPALKSTLRVGEVTFSLLQMGIVVTALLFWVGIYLFFHKTRPGHHMIATTNNPKLAEITGVNVPGVYRLAYMIGSVVMVPAAAYTAIDYGAVPHGGMLIFLFSAVAVIMGGIGNIKGAVIASYALSIIQNVCIWKIPSEWENGIVFFAFLLMIILKPRGFFSTQEGSLEE